MARWTTCSYQRQQSTLRKYSPLSNLRAARSALAGCWLGAAPPPPRPRGRPASHPGPRAPPIRRRSSGAGTLPPADWRPRPPVRARGTPAERSALRSRKTGRAEEGKRRSSAREGPGRERDSESRGPLPPHLLSLRPGPPSRRTGGAGNQSARGVLGV